MDQNLFKTYFRDSPLEAIFFKMGQWGKFLSLFGLWSRLVPVGFGFYYLHLHSKYAMKYPHAAKEDVHVAIHYFISAVAFFIIYIMYYRYAKQLLLAVTTDDSDFALEEAFRKNLRLLKLSTITFVVDMTYSGYLLARDLYIWHRLS